jgi:hypothetical protein
MDFKSSERGETIDADRLERLENQGSSLEDE